MKKSKNSLILEKNVYVLVNAGRKTELSDTPN